MAKNNLTPLQAEYKREYQRLTKGFSKYAAEGFVFPEESIRKNPQKVTQKLIQDMKKVKPKDLTKIASHFDTETGEIDKLEVRTPVKNIPTFEQPTTIKDEIKTPSGKHSTPKTKPKQQSKSKQKSAPTDAPSPTPNEPSYIPTLSIVDAIRERIAELPDRSLTGKGVQIAGRRNALLDILEDTINSLPDDDDSPYEQSNQAYEEYLLKNQETIFAELEAIKYDSKEERVDASFARVAKILNYGLALSAMQSESISSMQEMYFDV